MPTERRIADVVCNICNWDTSGEPSFTNIDLKGGLLDEIIKHHQATRFTNPYGHRDYIMFLHGLGQGKLFGCSYFVKVDVSESDRDFISYMRGLIT